MMDSRSRTRGLGHREAISSWKETGAIITRSLTRDTQSDNSIAYRP